MTWLEIITECRSKIDDEEQDLWTDQELIGHANGVLDEWIQQTRCITDSSTVDETLAGGSITLSGNSGSIAQVTVNGIVITSGAVAWNTDLATTAAALAANINAFISTPDYTATSVGAVVTIKAAAGTGSNPNGYSVAGTFTGTLSGVFTAMAGGNSLCEIYLIPGLARYGIDERIFEIIRAKPALRTSPLGTKTQEWMDCNYTNWEAAEGDPSILVLGSQSNSVLFYPKPTTADTVKLTVRRGKLKRVSHLDMTGKPEINAMYHEKIEPGILSKAYEKQRFGKIIDSYKARSFRDEFKVNMEAARRDELARNATEEAIAPPMVIGGRQR